MDLTLLSLSIKVFEFEFSLCVSVCLSVCLSLSLLLLLLLLHPLSPPLSFPVSVSVSALVCVSPYLTPLSQTEGAFRRKSCSSIKDVTNKFVSLCLWLQVAGGQDGGGRRRRPPLHSEATTTTGRWGPETGFSVCARSLPETGNILVQGHDTSLQFGPYPHARG